MAVRRYRERLSGPVLDRIDITQQLHPLKRSYLRAAALASEPSASVAQRVGEARQRQRRRLAPFEIATNAEVPGSILRRKLPLPERVDLLDEAVKRGQLSARGLDKVLRVAWSVADLAGRESPSESDLRIAIAMRRGEECEVRNA